MSFEPSPVNFSTLQRNILLNNLDTVELINLAVFSKSGTIEMSVSSTDTASGDWSINRRANGDQHSGSDNFPRSVL